MRRAKLITLATSLVLSASTWSQPAGGPGTGPGMRGGGYGYGHGMMGGGYGYGHGMMGGYGMGPGMMGGYGFGRMPNIPDLTKEQRDKISTVQKEVRQKQWALMDKMHDEFESQNPYRSGKLDEQAARKAYDASEKLHRQMFENSLDAHKRIEGILTPQQREQLQQAWGR